MATLHPERAEVRGYITFTLPVRTIERLQPFASRRVRSRFIEEAIEAALDKADAEAAENRERAGV
jgi:hypothetical protein